MPGPTGAAAPSLDRSSTGAKPSPDRSGPAAPATEAAASITIGFVGDVAPGRRVWNLARAEGPEAPYAPMRPILDRLDLAVGNLELCLSDGTHTPRTGRMVIHRDDGETIKHCGIGLFSLANNHVMDFGQHGLAVTLAFLREAGFGFFGAGSDLAEAEQPLVVACKGRKIAFLGGCDASEIHAGAGRTGVAPMIRRRLRQRVRAARELADIVVVVLHGDLEFVFHPAPFRQRLSRHLIDMGATMVIQHHPHVVQGLERYKGGLIAYSLGNYVFSVKGNRYQNLHPGTSDSVLLTVTLHFEGDAPRLEADTLPLRIDEAGCPAPCEPAEAERRIRQMSALSSQTLDPGYLRRQRFAACKAELRGALMNAYYTIERAGARAALRALLTVLRRRQNRAWLMGFLSGGRY